MISINWYTAQLASLPEHLRKQMIMRLRHSVRRGSLPSKREWKGAVVKAMKFSLPKKNGQLSQAAAHKARIGLPLPG